MVTNRTSKKIRARNGVVLAVLILAGLQGALGWAAAADDPALPGAALPSTFGVPEARIGDRIRYSLFSIDEKYDDPAVGNPQLDLFELEWVGTKQLWDKEQRPQLAAVGRIDLIAPNPHSYGIWGDRVQLYVAGNGEVVAYEQENSQVVSTDAGNATHVGRSMLFADSSFLRYNGNFCGLRSSIQGAILPLNRTVELLGRCAIPTLPNGKWLDEALQFSALRTDLVNNATAIVFSATDKDNQTVQVWFSEKSPYPVQIAIGQQGSLGSWQLARISLEKRGEVPIPARLDDLQSPPALEMAARTSSGLDDAGISHEFPASAAYRAAIENPEDSRFRDFARSPGAFLEYASSHYGEREQAGILLRDYMWYLTLVEMQIRERACVTLEERFLAAEPSTKLSSITRVSRCPSDKTEMAPRIESLPSELPTVRSVIAALDGLSESAPPSHAPVSWLYFIHCNRSCDEPRFWIRIGYEGDSFRDGEVPVTTANWESNGTFLDVSPEGRILAFGESSFDWAIEWVPTPKPTGSPESRGVAAPLQPLQVDSGPRPFLKVGWESPAPAATGGAALVAILVAIAYWTWPYVKGTGLLGLFSRVEKPKALDNASRNILFEAIQRSPGAHFQELCRISGIGHGAVQHHLDQLIGVGLVSRTETAGYHCYFPAGNSDRRWMQSAAFLKSDVAVRILQHIAADPEATGADIAAKTNVTTAAVSYHLKRFREAGLIDSSRKHGHLTIRLTDVGRTALANVAPSTEPVSA